MFTPSTAVIGMVSSIVTEILKFFPALRSNSIVTAITTIVVTCIVVLISTGSITFDTVVGSLVFALTSYMTIVQPVASTAALRTQS